MPLNRKDINTTDELLNSGIRSIDATVPGNVELNKMEFDVHNVYAHPIRVAKSIGLRKTAHSFGWDIMPRAVSAGIWRDVNLCAKEEVEFNQLYYNTVKLTKHTANLRFCWELSVSDEFWDLRVEIHGKKYCNHYIAGYPPFDFEWYKKCYEKLAKMYK